MGRRSAFPLVLCLSLLACLLLPAACAREPRLKVGVIAYEHRSKFNIEGYSTDLAARMAARDINAAGKVRIELEMVYVTEAPETSVDAVRLLANRKKVSAIVGPSMSKQAIPAGEAADQARIPLITSVSSNPDTTKGRSSVFRMCYLDPVQARAQARFALERFQPRSASLVYFEADPSSAGQAAVIQQVMGEAGKPLRRVLHPIPGDPSWDAEIRKAGPWRDEVVFLPASSDFSARAARSLREAGFAGTFVGGDGWDREAMKANPDFDGAFMTTNYWSGQATEGNAAFVAAYTAFAGRAPGDTAALTYDALGMLAAVVARTGKTDSESLLKGLADGTEYQGIAGAIRFEGSGDPERDVVLLGFSGGKIAYGGAK